MSVFIIILWASKFRFLFPLMSKWNILRIISLLGKASTATEPFKGVFHLLYFISVSLLSQIYIDYFCNLHTNPSILDLVIFQDFIGIEVWALCSSGIYSCKVGAEFVWIKWNPLREAGKQSCAYCAPCAGLQWSSLFYKKSAVESPFANR